MLSFRQNSDAFCRPKVDVKERRNLYTNTSTMPCPVRVQCLVKNEKKNRNEGNLENQDQIAP